MAKQKIYKNHAPMKYGASSLFLHPSEMSNAYQMFAHGSHETPGLLALLDLHLVGTSASSTDAATVAVEPQDDALEGGVAVEVLPKDRPGGADLGVGKAAANGG